jgi:hypothetical protein
VTTEDDETMADLRRIANQADPVPTHVGDAARAAFATRRLDDELAELLLDSELASQVRSAADDVRVLSFEAAGVSIELQVEQSTLRGLVSGASGHAVVESAGDSHEVPIDDGWFTVAGPKGPTRIRVTAENGTTVSTGWFSL